MKLLVLDSMEELLWHNLQEIAPQISTIIKDIPRADGTHEQTFTFPLEYGTVLRNLMKQNLNWRRSSAFLAGILACARVQNPMMCLCGYIPCWLCLQYQTQQLSQPQQQPQTQTQPQQPTQQLQQQQPLQSQQPSKEEALSSDKDEPGSPKSPVGTIVTPTPATTSVAPSPTEVDQEAGVDNSSDSKPKPWQKKKIPGFKVNKRIKRRRQNARLRKILQPKNAIMVLNELKTGIKFTFQEHTNALTQTMFVVNAEVDGKIYVGQGLSKPLAKQNAAENALKALLLEKMAEAAVKVENNDGTEPMQQDTNNGTSSATEAMDSSDGGSEGAKPGAPEDDVPWGSLASFALYKLFTDWQSQGTHVPIPKQQTPTVAPSQPVKTAAPAPMKKIPENPTERHPVMLLNQLRPGVQFTELSREGAAPNLTFTLGVTIDGKIYTGVAKNKKDAKKEAAKSALAGTFSIFYD